MNAFTRAAFATVATLLTALVAGCGGDELRLVVEPATLSMSGDHGASEISARARVSLSETPTRRVYLSASPDGLGLAGVGLTPLDETMELMEMEVYGDPTRAPGVYQGTVTVVGCREDEAPCNHHVKGSPARIPCTVEIR